MKTVTVYRIEHKDSGIGFIRHFILSYIKENKRILSIHENHNTFPLPSAEDLKIKSSIHHCAFTSLTEMLESVGVKDIKYLVRQHGFKVYELTVTIDPKQIGKRQVLFAHNQVEKKKNITNQFR